MNKNMRSLSAWILAVMLLYSTIVYAEKETSAYAYKQLTPKYMNSHMTGLAEEFSIESGIVEEVIQLLLYAGYVDSSDLEAGEYLFGKCEEISKEKGIYWDGLISVPFLYELYDVSGCEEVVDGDITRKKVGKWTRAIRTDESFFIGETDSDNRMINGLYYYSDMKALYWGEFNDNLRDGKGCILYSNTKSRQITDILLSL